MLIFTDHSAPPPPHIVLCNTRMTAVKVEWLTNGKKCFFTVSCVCNDESVTENSWYVGLVPEIGNRLFVMFCLLP